MKKIILFIILSFFVVSCRSKKINKQKEEVKIENIDKTESSLKENVFEIIEKENKDTVSEVNEISSSYLHLIPKDSLKPIIIVNSKGEKIEYYNANVFSGLENSNTKKSIKNQNKELSKKISNKNFDKKNNTFSNQSLKKESVKKDIKSNWFFIYLPWILWLILIIIILLIYIFRKKIPYLRNFF